MMELSIVIVNWNSRDFLSACLKSIQKFTEGISLEIIVIDSGSYDGTETLLKTNFPTTVFIQSKENVGFAKANNIAYKHAKGKYILFLNPDTELVSPAIHKMLDFIRNNPHAGAVGCKLLNGDGTIQTSCIQAFPSILGQFFSSEILMRIFPSSSLWGMSSLHANKTEACEAEVISGACLMVRREAFESAGGFSEDYFMYTEDVDLCQKLRRHGLNNYYLASASVKHFGGGSSESAPSNFSSVMMRDSIMRYFAKYRGNGYAVAYRFAIFISAALRIALSSPSLLLEGLFKKSSPRAKGTVRKWLSIMQWSLNPGRAYKSLTRKTAST